MKYTVYYGNYTRKMFVKGFPEFDLAESHIYKLISSDHKDVSYYVRHWEEGDAHIYDYGSHSNFFFIVKNDGEDRALQSLANLKEITQKHLLFTNSAERDHVRALIEDACNIIESYIIQR